MKLTQALLLNAKPGAKPYKLRDDKATNLYLHVSTAGGKRWKFDYRLGGTDGTYTLGSFPQVTLIAARKLRNKAAELVEKGIHPKAQDKQVQTGNIEHFKNTLWLNCAAWLEDNKSKWSEYYGVQAERLFPGNVLMTANGMAQTPDEYLAFVVDSLQQSQLARFREHDDLIGCSTELIQGVLFARVVDEPVYRAFLLGSKHLSLAKVDEIIALEKEIEPLFVEGALNYVDRLKNVSDFVKRIIKRDDLAKLADVPLGVAHLAYVHCGAMPVPTQGAVVLVSSSLCHLTYWITWLDMLRGNQHLPIEGRQRLVAALPDLAKQILGDTPINGQFRYFVPLACNSDVFREPAVERRLWLAQAFLVLHEYGHIVKGHTSVIRGWSPDEELSEPDLLARRATQRQFEFEADAFACEALRHVRYEAPMDPTDVYPEMMLMVDQLFLLFYVAERESFHQSVFSTHPPAAERWRSCLRTYLDDTTATVQQAEQWIEEHVSTHILWSDLAQQLRLLEIEQSEN